MNKNILYKQEGFFIDEMNETEKKETEEEIKKRMGIPKYDVEKLLKELEIYEDIKEKWEG